MFYITLLKTPEGKLLAIGLSMLIVLILFLGLVPFFDIGKVRVYIGMLSSNIVFGRAAGLLFGFAAGLPYYVVVFFTFVVEAIMVMLLYPLFILSMKRLIKIKFMEDYFRKLRESANKYKGKIKKYGAIALFVFVWIPFWMTGPVVGCVIGYFLGFSHTKIISLVLSGTCTAIIAWAFLLKNLGEQLNYIFIELSVVLLVSIIVFLFISWLKRKL